MDLTYKINRYHLPLLEIVDVTSTKLTFFVAFVYLESKREDKLRLYIADVQDVDADGNYGFRAITRLMNKGDDKWDQDSYAANY
ncbi:hypothetical protein FEM48_Zijuj07G0175000 [Ziziphus jujuba var. spinosa]|uniref:Uncharacterized protein n=1 Tax=Ziziphus jujuba var. spinosa TaxID=714518 RepID=A0A978V600_ZIZJJ|nr:hypothetical protein FEM48_Zijuj07G0175000 [Ziziphus jujuba var. spinosa]